MNTLTSSGETVTLAVGQDYTLKDNEVMINSSLYRKIDVEIVLAENNSNSSQSSVTIGIKKRDGKRNLPAEMVSFDKWEIDGVAQTSLSNCVINITTAIQ